MQFIIRASCNCVLLTINNIEFNISTLTLKVINKILFREREIILIKKMILLILTESLAIERIMKLSNNRFIERNLFKLATSIRISFNKTIKVWINKQPYYNGFYTKNNLRNRFMLTIENFDFFVFNSCKTQMQLWI